MFAVLKLEFIGEDLNMRLRHARQRAQGLSSRPWVARLTGRDPTYGYQREFLDGQIDYSEANSTGSRGVYLYFHLDVGIYEVFERTSWKASRRYFVRCNGRDIDEIDREEVNLWLSKGLESTS